MSSQRRNSLGFGATPKLERRLMLRKMFDELDTDGSGGVTADELQYAIENNQEIATFFSSKVGSVMQLFSRMDINGDGIISWEEFMTYLWNVENQLTSHISEADLVLERGDKSRGKSLDKRLARMGVNRDLFSGDGNDPIPVQRVAIDVCKIEGSMVTTHMSVDDPRAVMAPDSKLILRSTDNPTSSVQEWILRRGLSPSQIAKLTTVSQEAIIKLCGVEIEVLSKVKGECASELERIGKIIMEDEKNLSEQKEAATRALFMLRVSSSKNTIPPDLQQMVSSALASTSVAALRTVDEFLASLKGPVTSSRLARELATSQSLLEQKEKQLKSLQSEMSRNSPGNGLTSSGSFDFMNDFDMIDTDGDGVLSRDEWRKWADEKMLLLQSYNDERRAIVVENKRLRQSLNDVGTNRAESALRTHDEERAHLMNVIATLQTSVANLETEYRVASNEIQSIQGRQVTLAAHNKISRLTGIGGGGAMSPLSSRIDDDPMKKEIVSNWREEVSRLQDANQVELTAFENERMDLVNECKRLEDVASDMARGGSRKRRQVHLSAAI